MTATSVRTQWHHAATIALLDAAWNDPRAHVIGLTGPPGVGKSTLTSALINRWRREGLTVGVIAVDPVAGRIVRGFACRTRLQCLRFLLSGFSP